MSKITESQDVQRVPEEKFKRVLFQILDDIKRVVNGQIEFESNVRGKIVSVTFTQSNTDTIVQHGLSKPVTGYIVISLSASMVVYGTQSTDTQIILRASAPGVANLFFF